MTTQDMIVGGLILIGVFCVGIVVGIYIGHAPGGRHRLGNRSKSSVPLPVRPDPASEWHVSPEELEKFKRDLDETMADGGVSKIHLLREHYDTNSTAEQMGSGHWEVPQEDLAGYEPGFKDRLDDPMSWRPLSGSLELQQPTLEAHPLPAVGPALGSIQGPVRPVFGKTEHVMYDPDEYEGPLACNNCRTPLIKGQMFWSISLPEEGEDVILPICTPCEANTHD